ERAFWIANIGMHADRAVHAVVGDDYDRVGAILAGGGDLISHHQRAPGTEKSDDPRPSPAPCCCNRHWHARAPPTDDPREKDLALPKTDIAMHKAAEIAGIGRNRRVRRQVLVDFADDIGEIDPVRGRLPFLR